MRSGICQFCGCSHFNPCPQGCGWVNGDETLCTACTPVVKAWVRARLRPVARRAFARGFVAGAGDLRADEGQLASPASVLMTVSSPTGRALTYRNPYARQSARHAAWVAGAEAGQRWRVRHAA
jgi:hypothetical protein